MGSTGNNQYFWDLLRAPKQRQLERMAQQTPNGLQPPNIWKQMSYPAPRGPCAHKSSLMTPACACLRFMIHPLKASTSFDCDGCSHHASFHKMENKAEDDVVARWRAAETAKDEERRGQDGEELVDLVMGGADGARKRSRLEAAVGGRLDTLMEFVGGGGDGLGEAEKGVGARRVMAPRKRQGKERVRRVVDLEAEYTG